MANRGLRSNGEAPSVSLRPTGPENFAAPLLPSSALTPSLRAVAESASTLISPQEAARRFGVCRATIYNLCKRGVLPHVRIGSSVRLALPDVITALVQHRDRTS
jgi:excisionase family DNA binding protein